MFLTKKHISRREVLQGVGAVIGLPLLEAMIPAGTAFAQTAAGKKPTRFAFIGFPHGAIMDRWSPAETGTNFTISEVLKPLEPFKKHLTIVSGLRNKPAETPEPHGYIEQGWLTAEQLAVLDDYLPERLVMGNGRKSRLTYHKEGPPVLSARIQELYGIEGRFTIGHGRVPVKIEVLAPNQRPIQVTDDLSNFWREQYPKIKTELSRRYPRHEWR